MRHAEKHPELIVSAPITSGNVGISSASDHAQLSGWLLVWGGFWRQVAAGIGVASSVGWLPALGGFWHRVASGVAFGVGWLLVSG